MARRNDVKRSQIIEEMESLYKIGAYSDTEMADKVGRKRGTVNRIRREMIDRGIPIEEKEYSKYHIRQDYRLTDMSLNREQAATLYLAARRMQQQTKTSQAHVATALEKLSHALEQPLAGELVQNAREILSQEQDNRQEKIFTILVECWLTGVPANITHRTLHGKQAHRYRVRPYLIEPSVWGDGLYLIGYSEHHQRIATFKLTRIEEASKATGTYEIPKEFDIHTLLEHAWGIWHADEEPVTVRLHFNKWITPRVKESIWHPKQTITFQEDGSSIWAVDVAEWKEMVPWIRGWGSDVEGLAPEGLRDAITKEVGRLMKTYQVYGLMEAPRYQLLWAKTSRDRRYTHPLICHLIDVGQVALALWNQVLAEGFRQQMAAALELDVEACGRGLAFWVALHDLGKACPGFQRKYEQGEKVLAEAGFCFPMQISKDPCYHATVTTVTLASLLMEETMIPKRLARKIAQALGGHHGFWPTAAEMQGVKLEMQGDGLWDEVRQELVHLLRDIFAPPTVDQFTADVTTANTFLTLFSGLTTVADWIGSMEEHFDYVDAPIDCQAYAVGAAQKAEKVLQKLQWIGPQEPEQLLAFQELFPFEPNALQRDTINLAEQLEQPALVVIESATGSGKTEASLFLANYWLSKRQQRGVYIGMPTMATSNQMHTRTTQFLAQRYPQQRVEPLLVHSQAQWLVASPPPEINTVSAELDESSVQDMSWFLPRKRSLLAPFAVGTVDQALMGTLQTRHFFVRLFGLSNKTVIFDEVHAYDTYMSTLFQQLLGWLQAVGASVILLSATLPDRMRRDLIEAYSGAGSFQEDVQYPAITWAMAEQSGSVAIKQTEESKPLYIEWIQHTPESIQATLATALAEGGCAAVICNTVDRAQSLYETLDAAQIVADDDLILFHARYPFGWRDAIEKEVLKRFGKAGPRPHKSIVVATQVIEQSLDLDFDVMISELAPVDLMLQRAGRLHRHPRDKRPQGLVDPKLIIPLAMDEMGLPDFGNDPYIYERYILLRSYLTLKERNMLSLPEETSALIEAVYDDGSACETTSELAALLQEAKDAMDQQRTEDEGEAKSRLVPPPGFEALLNRRNSDLAEDGTEVNRAIQALTRLGPPTVSVVCLHQVGQRLHTEPDGSGVEIDLERMPDAIETKALAQATLTLQKWKFDRCFKQGGEKPTSWQEHSLLQDRYLITFNDGEIDLTENGYMLSLFRKTGLKMTKEKE